MGEWMPANQPTVTPTVTVFGGLVRLRSERLPVALEGGHSDRIDRGNRRGAHLTRPLLVPGEVAAHQVRRPRKG